MLWTNKNRRVILNQCTISSLYLIKKDAALNFFYCDNQIVVIFIFGIGQFFKFSYTDECWMSSWDHGTDVHVPHQMCNLY